MLKELLMSGSLMSPFQPTVVLGFSKYARITINSSLVCFSLSDFRRLAYSSAELGSWMEHGPMTMRRRLRGSRLWRMSAASSRAVITVAFDAEFCGISC